MADRGFNIQDDLTPLGVRINIPPFLKGKEQLDGEELIEHVESHLYEFMSNVQWSA